MVFVGNLPQGQTVESLVKTSHLLSPFPEDMIDAAFFDRFHAYVPGWEIPKMRPEFFTDRFGLIVDYLAEYLREMRKISFADALDKHFKLGNNLNQRDTIAVRRTVSGLLKLLCPNGEYNKEQVRKCLEYALEARRRVKEQLKKIGGMEFYDVHFSYIDLEDQQERFITVPEQGGGGLIPEGQLNPGVLHTISMGGNEMPGVYRIEIQAMAGSGKLSVSGSLSREPVRVAFDYFKANAGRISASIHPTEKDFHLHLVDLTNGGPPNAMTLAGLIALCSAALNKPIQGQMVVMGDMSLGGTIVPARNLAESLQVAFDAGAKRILLPMSSVTDIPTVPGELFAKFQTSFYSDPVNAAFKALGVE
jgi:ATP-dependent Lon protease